MTKNFKFLLEEAHALGLTTEIIYPEKEVVEISSASRKILVKEVFTIVNDAASASATLAKNKEITYRFWERAGIPFPRSRYFKSAVLFPKSAQELGLKFPVIFKKSNGKKSIGLRPNIQSFEDLTKIVDDSDGSFIIQEMVFGKEYRLLIYNDRLLGALEHAAPRVIGNGVDTIAALLQEKSAELRKKILLGDKVIGTLEKAGLTLDSIPAQGVSVLLRETSCLSEGASSIDRTDMVHPDILELAKKAAKTVNMKLAGIDLICEDISVDPKEQKISFLETNSFPSLSIHYTPMTGQPRRVIKDILEDLFELNRHQ